MHDVKYRTKMSIAYLCDTHTRIYLFIRILCHALNRSGRAIICKCIKKNVSDIMVMAYEELLPKMSCE